MAACNISTLLTEACSNGYSGLSQRALEIIQTQLLCEIVAGGGTGGGGLSGAGSPQGVVTANPGQTYYDTTGGTFWVKASGTGNTGWQQLI